MAVHNCMNTQLLVKKYLDRTVPGIPAFQDFFALPFQTYNNFSAYISHVFSRTQLSLLK